MRSQRVNVPRSRFDCKCDPSVCHAFPDAVVSIDCRFVRPLTLRSSGLSSRRSNRWACGHRFVLRCLLVSCPHAWRTLQFRVMRLITYRPIEPRNVPIGDARHRRSHDLRRTFITLARVDGARGDILEHVTHAQRGDIINVYTSLRWAALCEEVAKLKVERRQGHLHALNKNDQTDPRRAPTFTTLPTTASTIAVARVAEAWKTRGSQS